MSEQASTLPLRSVYGLTVECDLALPELCIAGIGAQPDLVIQQGAVPPIWEVTDELNTRAFVDGAVGHLWLRFPGILRMSVREGRSIIYELEPGAEEDAARLFLLGSGLGAILMQRGFVVVHGNGITLPGNPNALVCIGDSGAGKSTTAIAMMQRGYSILADDICPIGSAGEIAPGMPRAKLWDATARHLSIDTVGLSPVRTGDAKYNLPLGNRHCNEPRTIGVFVWLVPGDVERIEHSEVTGVEKFAVLRNNIYRQEYLLPLGLEADYLKRVAQIASETQVVKIVRPQATFDIDPLLDTISLLYEQPASELAQAAQE